jgi:fluoroacetyl-CoA thioesterase
VEVVMKASLLPGISYEFSYTVPDEKTVPHLLPESQEFRVMPNVLATGYLVVLIEWTCIQAVNPHLDWPAEQTVGTGVNISHSAATPPGMTIKIKVVLEKVDRKKLTFSVEASDELDEISSGIHERFIIDAERFSQKLAKKSSLLHP